jgi:uncharacterized protein
MSTETCTVSEAVHEQRQLAEGEQFRFACNPSVACFNRCCADVNILLTPVDVLRLARRLHLTTREFLDRHTLTPITKELHLPVVIMRMREEAEKRCEFVGENGCTVYEDRPWACRMYPLGMALPPARAGVEPTPISFLFEDDFCLGREQAQIWTAATWRKDQRAEEQEEIEAGFRDLVSHPWFIGGRQLDPKRMEMFFLACYDLDTFRRLVLGSSFRDRFVLGPDLIERLRSDDLELLRFAFRWLRFALFAEPTMTVREKGKS